MNVRTALAIVVLLTAGSVLSAAPVTIGIAGTFQDGGSLSGQITFDNVTNTVLSFNVTTAVNGVFGSTYALPGADTGSILLGPYTPTAFVIHLQHPPGGTALTLILPGSPSTFAGGPILTTVTGSGGATSQESAPSPPFPIRLLAPGTAALISARNVPTVSSGGFLALTLLLGFTGVLLLRRAVGV
jgi:hypothetical protein